MASTPSPNHGKIIAITSTNSSSFITKSLVSRLLRLSSDLTIRVADPSLQTLTLTQSDRIVHFQTQFDDLCQLRSAIDGSFSVFHVDPTIGVQPAAASDWWRYYKEVVEGTRNVVKVCRECGVERLVYTGTADVVFDGMREIVAGDESLPYSDKFMDVLNDLRVQAEMLVLNANGRDGLSTCVLRACNPFGPGDDYFVPLLVGKAKSAWAKFIIGGGQHLCDFTYVENVAHANICAEQALCSNPASVAGKPFFITNQETVKFWEFNSNILEGLGYKRPKLHLPVKLILLIVALVERVPEKLHLGRTYKPFLSPATIHAFSCTRTFDCSKAQKHIGYFPVNSLEDGISVTVESFSQLANCLPYLRQRDYSIPSKAESLLGNGKVAEILLWRDEKRTFTYLLGLFLLFHWFFLSGRTFISSTAKLLLLVSVILFSQGVLPSSMLGFTIEKMPSSYFEISEFAVRHSLATLACIWNNSLFILKSVSQEGSLDVFLKCEEEVEKLMTIASRALKKSKETLMAKLSRFLASYVRKRS